MRILTLDRWDFTPNLLPGVASLVLVVLFIRLGVWQLERADAVRAQESAIMAQAQLTPLDLNRAATSPEDWDAQRWRLGTARGRWQNQAQILLDNQPADGRVGYFVFTLLRLEGCDCAQLVNRGWIEADPDRSILPDIRITPDAVTLRGTLTPLPPSGLGVRADVEHLPAGLLRLQRLDLAAIPLPPGIRVLPLILQLDATASDGFQRKWPRPGLKAERHVAYAVQWFVFALIVTGLYLGFNIRRSFCHDHHRI